MEENNAKVTLKNPEEIYGFFTQNSWLKYEGFDVKLIEKVYLNDITYRLLFKDSGHPIRPDFDHADQFNHIWLYSKEKTLLGKVGFVKRRWWFPRYFTESIMEAIERLGEEGRRVHYIAGIPKSYRDSVKKHSTMFVSSLPEKKTIDQLMAEGGRLAQPKKTLL